MRVTTERETEPSTLDTPSAANATAGYHRDFVCGTASSELGVVALPAGMYGELTSDPAADQLRLDAWGKEQTGGLIPTMPLQLTDRVLLTLAMALTVCSTWLRPFTDGIDLFKAGLWAGLEIHVLRRSIRILDRARVADAPAGPLTLLRVMGTGGIDVHLVLSDDLMNPGHILNVGIGALAGRHPATRVSLLRAGSPGPGLTVRHVRDHAPDDVLNVRVSRFTITATHVLLNLPNLADMVTVTDPTRGHFPGAEQWLSRQRVIPTTVGSPLPCCC
ncbi:hypothetical protein [Nonomuraea sp. NPDC052265]|uniref:hypothetical protein n=1 Tax=Nonomuraea sp. NPDC052265 TaxID=3364374 RepID=UPI0037C999D7